MGSIAAIAFPVANADMQLRKALDASRGRRSALFQTVSKGDWTLGASGEDAWLAEDGGWVGVGTGVIDDIPQGVAPGIHLIRASHKGPEALARLRGVFSAIATDGRQLLAWRDHVGFSPLFAAGDPPRAIATSARQALVGAGLPVEADAEMVRRVFWAEQISEEATYFRGASRIPKASVLSWKDGQVRFERYWEPRALLETRSPRIDHREEFLDRMKTAVRRALGPDSVVSLSGGIDAPAVAGFAAPIHLQSRGRPLAALSSIYPDLPAVDESRYIELVSERLGIDLHTFVPKAGPLEDVKNLIEIAEAPVPTVSLAESAEYYALAKEMGFRTILTGEMAEFVMAMGIHTLPHLLWRGRFPSAWRYVATEKRRGVPIKRMMRSTVSSAVPETWRRRRLARLGHLSEQKVTWMSRNKGGGRSPKARFGRGIDTWESQQLSAFAGPGLSVEADEALQTAHSVRVRRPWLDVDLWEFFIALPAEVKYPSGQYKALMRRWLREVVPDEILDRRDRTFFDDSFFARLDLSLMRELIDSDGYEMPGVDYPILKKRLEDGGLSLIEAMWAKDLAVIHAFMDGGR